MKDVHTSVSHIGPTCKQSTYVKNIQYLDENNIGAEGCSYLIKAHWINLQMIDLCKKMSNI